MPGFSKLAVKPPEHAPSVLKQFNTLRRKGLLCDCVIKIEETEFTVHRPFLAACSPYFEALFMTKMLESQSPVVKIQGVSVQTFETILDFMYTSEIILNESNITEIFPAAELFQLCTLEDVCVDFFINQLCASNCLGIWRYGRNYCSPKLERSAWICIVDHFVDVVGNEEFQSLSKEELCEILRSDDLDIDSEMDVYRAAMIWLQSDLPRRKQAAKDILECVRFPVLPAEALSSLLASQKELASTNTSLCELLIQAKNAQRLRSTRSRQKKISAFKRENLTPRRSRKAIMVVGGYSGEFVSKCEIYDEKTESWQECEFELSSWKHFHWVGVIGMRLYALGGNSIANINQVTSKFTSSAAKLLQSSALSTEWEPERTLPHDCSGMQVCLMDDCIFTCGETPINNDTTVYGISCYRPSLGEWEFLSTLSHVRVLAGFASYANKLYLLGGMDPNSGEILAHFESYDPNTGTWVSDLPALTTGRYHMGTAVLNGCIYVIGGIGDGQGEVNTLLNTVEVFSFARGSRWSLVAPLSGPRAGITSCVWNGKIFAIGGETSDRVNCGTVEEFDPSTEKWRTIASLKHPRIYPNAIIV